MCFTPFQKTEAAMDTMSGGFHCRQVGSQYDSSFAHIPTWTYLHCTNSGRTCIVPTWTYLHCTNVDVLALYQHGRTCIVPTRMYHCTKQGCFRQRATSLLWLTKNMDPKFSKNNFISRKVSGCIVRGKEPPWPQVSYPQLYACARHRVTVNCTRSRAPLHVQMSVWRVHSGKSTLTGSHECHLIFLYLSRDMSSALSQML